MITGRVTRHREPRIRLSIHAPNGEPRQIEGIVDTGFNGSLTLPMELVQELQLPWRTRSGFRLANGAKDYFDIHAADISWDGAVRRILVEATGVTALVGMTLLEGYELNMLIVDGGLVRLTHVLP